MAQTLSGSHQFMLHVSKVLTAQVCELATCEQILPYLFLRLQFRGVTRHAFHMHLCALLAGEKRLHSFGSLERRAIPQDEHRSRDCALQHVEISRHVFSLREPSLPLQEDPPLLCHTSTGCQVIARKLDAHGRPLLTQGRGAHDHWQKIDTAFPEHTLGRCSCLAFFSLRPGVRFSGLNRLLVAVPAVARRTRQVSTVIEMRTHPPFLCACHCQPPAVPDAPTTSLCRRSVGQDLGKLRLLFCYQTGPRSWCRMRVEGLFPCRSSAGDPLASYPLSDCQGLCSAFHACVRRSSCQSANLPGFPYPFLLATCSLPFALSHEVNSTLKRTWIAGFSCLPDLKKQGVQSRYAPSFSRTCYIPLSQDRLLLHAYAQKAPCMQTCRVVRLYIPFSRNILNMRLQGGLSDAKRFCNCGSVQSIAY